MDKICGFLVKLFFLAASYMTEIKELFYVMAALVLIDLITGLWKSIKFEGWKAYKSRTLKRSVIKIAAYGLAVVTTFLIEKEIIMSGIYVCRAVVGLICLVEASSIFENLARITGNNVFLKIFDTLKTYLNTDKNIINKIDTKKENDETIS